MEDILHHLTPVLPDVLKPIKIVQKGWGEEVWLVNDDFYCLKLLKVNKGGQCSIHFHIYKRETFYVIDGGVQLYLRFNLKEKIVKLHKGQSITIPRLVEHKFSASGSTKILECSTKHREEDSIRIEKGDSQIKTLDKILE